MLLNAASTAAAGTPAAAPAATPGLGLFGGAAAAPAAAPGAGLFGGTPAAGGGLFGGGAMAPAPAGGMFGGGGMFGSTALTTTPAAGGGLLGAPGAAAAAAAPTLRLNMEFEKLPAQTKEWLEKTEKIINEWDWRAQQMPEARGELRLCERLADVLEHTAEAAADSVRRDEGRLATLKGQVEANLNDARQAESDFAHRFDLQAYGRQGQIPSPYFARQLGQMASEVVALRSRIAELDGAVTSAAKPPMAAEELEALLRQQKALFDAAATKLQRQHQRVDAHRQTLRACLRRDPFAEARQREASVRDKYKPALQQPPLPVQMPPAAAPGAPGAPGAMPGAPAAATGLFGAPAPTAANPFGAPAGGGLFGAPPATPGATGALGANPFAATPAAPALGGGLFGAAPAPAAAAGGLFGAATPAANPFGAAPGAPGPFGATPLGAGGSCFGMPALGAAPSASKSHSAKKKVSSGGRK